MSNLKVIKSRRGFLQIPFSWVFAIIVGILIIFLAIYFATKMIDSGGKEVSTTTAKQIEVLMNPLETSFEDKSAAIALPSNTRIYNRCYNTGEFGKQGIQLSQKSFNKWGEFGEEIISRNKYIFSEEFVGGKNIYLYSIPFENPFKIASLITMTSKGYCFIDAPRQIEDDIIQENVEFDENKCSEESVKVCFGEESYCDIEVDLEREYVEKDGERLYFKGDLIYAAIFADAEIYECQVKRLMQRTEQLASLYWDKSNLVRKQGCESGIDAELLSLANSAKEFESSEDLDSIEIVVKRINEKEVCELW